MRIRRLGLGAGIALVLVVMGATSSDALAKGRRRPHFRSRRAPAHAKVPNDGATSNSAGGGGGAAADVAVGRGVAQAPLEGGFRQDVVDGGSLLAMTPGRALLLSSYRGLLLVDTSDPDSPKTLTSLPDLTNASRFFPTGDLATSHELVVLSQTSDAGGSTTRVAVVSWANDTLSVVGSVDVAGSSRDAARAGDELVVVTGDGYGGPPYMMANDAGAGAGVLAAPRRGAPRKTNASGGVAAGPTSDIAFMPWFGNSTSHVARVRIGADRVPVLLGAADVAGDVQATSLTGTDAILAVEPAQREVPWLGAKANAVQGSPVQWTPPTVSLVHVDGSAGAPTVAGSLALAGTSWVATLARSGSKLFAIVSQDAGDAVLSFDVSGAAPAEIGAPYALDGWPGSYAFSGNALVFAEPQQYLPDPVVQGGTAGTGTTAAGNVRTLQPNGTSNGTTGTTSGPGSGSTQTGGVAVLDLTDPAAPALHGPLAQGPGYVGSLVATDFGVVGTTSDFTDAAGTTTLFLVDVSSPANPVVRGDSAATRLDGSWSVGPALGDLLLLNGAATAADGSYAPSVRLVSLAGAGGPTLGGTVPGASWASATARAGNLLGLGSFDRLALVDVSDVANPVARGELRLVVNVAGFAALDAGHGVALTTGYVDGSIEIRTVTLPAADALAPLATLSLGTGDAQMYANPPFVYVVASNWSTGDSSVRVVDCSDPSAPRERGHLDLAGYPGQVFPKGSALLMLREAWTLFDQTATGATKADADAFGRCPRWWLRDGLSTALDVLDLSDPDHPSAARRLRLQWDSDGQAVLAGDTLYVPSYVDTTSPIDDVEQYAYFIRPIDVTDALHPVAHAAVNVPGTLVAATPTAGRVLTAEYRYDDTTGATTATLHLVDLARPWWSSVVASRDLAGSPETVTVGGSHAYVVAENWNVDPAAQDGAASSRVVLDTLATSDLSLEDEASRDQGAWDGRIAGNCLFLRTWGWNGSMDAYSLADPAKPSFLASHDVVGTGEVVVVAGRAYVAAGLYGVQSFDLNK